MNLVVAVDGSDSSDAALDHAVEMTQRLDATLTVVYAVNPDVRVEGGSDVGDPVRTADDAIVQESVEDAEARGERILDAAAKRAETAGVDVTTELLYGDPVEAIPEYAEGEDVDALYVGHRGLSERAEAVLGSVAKALVERSPVPVTVVR